MQQQQQQKHNPQEGDYFRWRFTEKYIKEHKTQVEAGTLYWCMAQICVYSNKQRYEDIYWNSSGNKIINTEDVVLEYLGNINDYREVRSKYDFKYYDHKDILDISHANRNGGYYIKEGAKKSRIKIKESLLEQQREAEYKLYDAKSDIDRVNNKIKELEELTEEQLESFWF